MRLFRLQLSNLPVFFRKRVGMSGINALVVREHSIMAIRQTVVAGDQLVIVLLKHKKLTLGEISRLHFTAILENVAKNLAGLLGLEYARYKLTVKIKHRHCLRLDHLDR
jgi:hypothetical protein